MTREPTRIRHEVVAGDRVVVIASAFGDEVGSDVPSVLCPCTAEIQQTKNLTYIVIKDKRGQIVSKGRVFGDPLGKVLV